MQFFDTFNIYMIFSGKTLTGISFKKPAVKKGAVPENFKNDLRDYFDGKLHKFTQKTAFEEGTDFEREVWLAIKDIPYGETRTYKWLAERVGSPEGSRAVGQALSKNPLPIVIPCHRIIESTGKIGGYSSGEGIKRRLLEMEYYNSLSAEDTGD
jgi:methylated-DNA-[protein]-cysteine S-methyltransferase